MALNFPSAPVVGQTYTSSGKIWRWTGSVWGANTDVFTSAVVAVTALDIDCSQGNYFTKTISSNSTFTFSNIPSSAYSMILEITQTSGTITWPATVKWPGNLTPTLTAGKTHLFILITDDSGVSWRGASNINYNT